MSFLTNYNYKSQGPDGIHLRVLKEVTCKMVVFPETCSLSLKLGSTLRDGKVANIRLNFKRDLGRKPGNHRPVSLW